MSESQLPARPSLEFLKKRAKERLKALRTTNPAAKLADALLAVARDHGFSSWRALKAEVDARQAHAGAELFAAVKQGDVASLRDLLAADPLLARAVAAGGQYGGWTVLHEAAKHGQTDAAALLLQHGADPNAREAGDNTSPLHWAAARGDVPTMRLLLDAGGDVHGFGADHAGDVIGWGTFLAEPGKDVRAVADFLVSRGARHSIFSAMSVGDLDLVRAVVEDSPDALDRRLSRFEDEMTPLHLAVHQRRDDMLDLLIELGADLDAVDVHGQTPLSRALAMDHHAAARRLLAAGAKPPKTIAAAELREAVATLAPTTRKIIPMISVPDVAAALDWYVSIGFTELGRFGDDGIVNWGIVQYGDAAVMFTMHGEKRRQPVSLWFYTDQVDALYQLFKARQLESAQAALQGQPVTAPAIDVHLDIYNPFYGGREFGIRDPNGYELYFRKG
jgi:ankyrin repeat protein